jgi:hypothetical protein
MKMNFDIDKIVSYLERFKFDLHKLYTWNAKIDRLVELDTLTDEQVIELNSQSPYEKEIRLKKIVGKKLLDTLDNNKIIFDNLCLWIIKDWGGISTASDRDTLNLLKEFFATDKPDFNRIASASKVGAYMYPNRNVIYDSRVAYSLNWIILLQNAGQHFFPIPEGRNSKMVAFDLNVLIRLKNVANYLVDNIEQLDNRRFIKNADKNIFIDNKDAYFELNKLIKMISQKLWKGDSEKEQYLYYTEMLLFSIADREVILDIITHYSS